MRKILLGLGLSISLLFTSPVYSWTTEKIDHKDFDKIFTSFQLEDRLVSEKEYAKTL